MSHAHSNDSIADPAAIKSIEAGIELSDVNPTGLVVFAITLFVSLIIIIGASGLIFEVISRHENEASRVANSTVLNPPDQRPLVPLGAPLQPSQEDPQMDWQELAGMKATNNYIESTLSDTPVPMMDGRAHTRIPVKWGIELVAKDGLSQFENKATDIPVPVGTAISHPTEYSPAYSNDGRNMVTH